MHAEPHGPGLRVCGWGTALPDKTLTNADLEARLDTTDAWITERTGIRERRIGSSTAELAIEAALAALSLAGSNGDDVDVVLLATSTPDQAVPATSAVVHDAIGASGGAFDLNAACAGFVYGVIAANGFLQTGADRVLLIGAETMSRITDWDDRNTAVLFGDGAGAVLLERSSGNGRLLGWDAGTDGSARHLISADHGGTMTMDGRELFRRAVRVVVESTSRALDRAGVAIDDVSLLVPHQANTRIIDAACSRLGLDPDRTASVIEYTGNTSAASVPLALADSLESGRIKDNDIVVLCGFGAGMTWATTVLRWEGPL